MFNIKNMFIRVRVQKEKKPQTLTETKEKNNPTKQNKTKI